MKTFNWKEAEENYCEAAYYYLLHVHVKNIQEVDFIRGYTSLPHRHCFRQFCQDPKKAESMYRKLKEEFGFFMKEKMA